MTNKNILPILEGYCKRGWKLFPCRSGAAEWTDRNTGEVRTAAAKTPLVRNWPQAATDDPAQIKRWMAQFPGCMWGCAAGSASGFVALDLDRGHDGGADGVEALRAYMRERGLTMPATLTQRTAGGGMHFLFRMPAGADIRNATAILPGVDVRGSGGYIIVAPSFNQDAGAAYEWQDAAAPIADAPAWLVELVSQKGRPEPVPDAKSPDTGAQAAYSGTEGGTPYGLRALRDEIAMLRTAEQGSRNDTLNRCAVKLYALAAGGELDADAVTRELEAAASAIGLPYAEAAATLASARKGGYAAPRKAPEQGADPVQEAQAPDAWEPIKIGRAHV